MGFPEGRALVLPGIEAGAKPPTSIDGFPGGESPLGLPNRAVLQAKIEIKSTLPPGSEPTSTQNHRFLQEDDNPDPPSDPPGGEYKNNITNVLEYSLANMVFINTYQ